MRFAGILHFLVLTWSCWLNYTAFAVQFALQNTHIAIFIFILARFSWKYFAFAASGATGCLISTSTLTFSQLRAKKEKIKGENEKKNNKQQARKRALLYSNKNILWRSHNKIENGPAHFCTNRRRRGGCKLRGTWSVKAFDLIVSGRSVRSEAKWSEGKRIVYRASLHLQRTDWHQLIDWLTDWPGVGG